LIDILDRVLWSLVPIGWLILSETFSLETCLVGKSKWTILRENQLGLRLEFTIKIDIKHNISYLINNIKIQFYLEIYSKFICVHAHTCVHTCVNKILFFWKKNMCVELWWFASPSHVHSKQKIVASHSSRLRDIGIQEWLGHAKVNER
jgi:hypothetical protein